MTDFMYLFWNTGGRLPQWTQEEVQKQMQKWTNWTDSLSASDHLKAGDSLENRGKLVSGPDKTVSEGPYNYGGGMVAGYLIVSARDMEEAVELSKTCPVLEGGWMIEVRQIRLM